MKKTLKKIYIANCLYTAFILLISLTVGCGDGNDNNKPWINTDKTISWINVSAEGFQDDKVTKIDTSLSKIDISVPFDFDQTNVALYFQCQPMVTVSPDDKTRMDFTNPVTYNLATPDGSAKDYTVIIKCRNQLPLNVDFTPPNLKEFPPSSGAHWGQTVIVSSTNLLKYKKDNTGEKIKSTISLINTNDNTERNFIIDPTDILKNTYSSLNVNITIPDGLPVGEYKIKVNSGTIFGMAKNMIQIAYGRPSITNFPDTIKVGSTIQMNGKYFTDIPTGTHNTPRLRLAKYTNLNSYFSSDFPISSFTSTSITAKVVDLPADAKIYAKPTQLHIYDPAANNWRYVKDCVVID